MNNIAQTVNIILTLDPSTKGWQENNSVQIMGNGIYLYLKKGIKNSLNEIQQVARKIESFDIKKVKLIGEHWNIENQWAFALGYTCASKLSSIEFTGDQKTTELLNDKLNVYAWSRDLTNQTPNQLYPLKLAELVTNYLKAQTSTYVTNKLIFGEALNEQGWVGIYNVGKGSAHDPCLLEIDFNPTGNENAPVSTALVGKGITFDTGGYSLKSTNTMFDMKCDMGGAAVTAGALALAIRKGLNKRVKLYLCCAENVVSGSAYKLSDILTYKNGVTVEVSNTDAEGRLVLADGLIAASETKAEVIIDAATLTGASVAATGGDYTALFGLDKKVMGQMKEASKRVNEPMWEFPLEYWHQDKCYSAFADTTNHNINKGAVGGASNAAGFLLRFAPKEGKGWLHMDLSAAYNANADNMWAAGATGQGIATIAEVLLR